MKCHPVCDLLPPLSDEDFAALREDIRKHGQRVPALVYDGQIVDGKHRHRACQELGIQAATTDLVLKPGESLVEFVLSLNFHRRHLTQSQRATVAVAMLPMLEAEAKERMRTRATDRPKSDGGKGKAAEQAGKLTGVSPRYVEKAKQLKEEDPEKFEEVKQGRMTITAAQDAKPPQQSAAQVKDGLGRAVMEPKLMPAFSQGAGRFDELMQRVSQLKSDIKSLAEEEVGAFLTMTQIEADLNCVRSALKFAKPYARCVYCGGNGCRTCRSTGWLGKDMHDQAPKELKS